MYTCMYTCMYIFWRRKKTTIAVQILLEVFFEVGMGYLEACFGFGFFQYIKYTIVFFWFTERKMIKPFPSLMVLLVHVVYIIYANFEQLNW